MEAYQPQYAFEGTTRHHKNEPELTLRDAQESLSGFEFGLNLCFDFAFCDPSSLFYALAVLRTNFSLTTKISGGR